MKTFLKSAIVACAMAASAAFAGSVGTASTNDVVLASEAADYFHYSDGVNPQGIEGSSGFDAAFDPYGTGAWEKIAKGAHNTGDTLTYEMSMFSGLLTFTFHEDSGTAGTWSVTNTSLLNDITMDLVFAMHVGGGSGAWLFDDQQIAAGQTLTGTWVQNMLNNGGRIADFSNVTFFGRDLILVPIEPVPEVPEPATLASLALGLGMLGVMRRRKQQ